MLELLRSDLQRELDSLRRFFAPYTTRVYMVGGSVRDLLRSQILGVDVEVVDLDLEVYGIEPALFERLMERLGAKGVGKSFFVYKYRLHIDISLPRIEKKIGRGHRAFAVELAKEEREASRRRDFCMNALMLNIFDATLLDFWGGIEDIAKRRIRIVDEEKFKEDSLRVLRGMQFSARLGFRIESHSCEVMRGIDLTDLSPDRIFWEFEKMFLGRYLHYGLFAMASLGVDQKIFGFSLNKKLFFKTALEMGRGQKSFEKSLYKFYFLYILKHALHKPIEPMLEALGAPKEYRRMLRDQKGVPKRSTKRFLAALAIKYPINRWLGHYRPKIKETAQELGIWEQKFAPVLPKELLSEGLRGAMLGKELWQRTLQIVRQRFACEEI